nr:hypothetical protein [Tanacetum cinerariifolium]
SPDGEMYYGQLQEILEFKYLLFKVVFFRVKWFDHRNQGRKVKRLVLRNNMTQIDTRVESFKDDQYILVTQVKQVFYLEDKAKPYLRVVEHVNHKKFFDGSVIVVEDDPDIIHFDNSSDLSLSTSLNDLDNATLHIDGQSTEVDVPPDIIDVVDEISADVSRSHDGNGGGDDRPLHTMYLAVAWVALLTEGSGQAEYPRQDPKLSLKEITDTKGPVLIQSELRDKQTVMPLGDHAAHWSSYIEEEHCPSRSKRQNRAKSTVISRHGSQSLARLRDEMFESGGASGSGGCGDEEEGADHQDD